MYLINFKCTPCFVAVDKITGQPIVGKKFVFGSKIFDFVTNPYWNPMKGDDLLAAQSILLSHGSKVYSVFGKRRIKKEPTDWEIKVVDLKIGTFNTSEFI